MLPAVILSAKVTIEGLNKANSELSVYNKQWEKVAGTVEAAGVSVDNTHKKIDELRAATAVPIVQEIRIEVNDDALRAYAGSAGSPGAAQAGGSTGSDAGFSAALLTKNMTQLRQWNRGHPGFFNGTSSSAGSNDIQKLIQMLQVMNSGSGGSKSSSSDKGWGIDAAQLFTGHSGGSHGRFPAPWWARLATGGGKLPGAGSLGSFAGFGAEHFLLSAGGVVGSGVAAAAGGGLLAAGALGKIAVGGGSDALVSAATIAGTKKITEAQTKWNEAIAQYGEYSKQARTAQFEFNQTMKEAGPAGEAELKLGEHAKSAAKLFNKDSGPAKQQSAKLMNQGLDVVESFVPHIANAADQNLTIINKDIKPLFKWLEGPEGIGIFNTLENKFKQDLPTTIHAFSQAIEFILKTIGDASKFTGGFTESLDSFFTKWNEPKNFAIWEEHIENLIEDFHMWMGFLKDVGGLLKDIFSNDAHTGSAIVTALDEMINKADEWVTSTEGHEQLSNIFQIHKEEILALLSIIPHVVTIFRQVYMEVAPPLVAAATAVLIVIGELLQKFEETGPLAKWALGIAVIAAKMGLLKPALKFIWDQLGLLPAKMSAIEASNAAVVDSNSALITSNDALAASYADVAAASETAAGVNATTGEVLQKHPGQMAMDIPEAATAEGSQLSLLGTTPANGVTKDASLLEKEGTGLGGTLVAGLSKAIPVAAATYGVVNILTSVFSKGKNHMKEAGFEAGGALVGGVAGFLIGGPVGAMIGVGLGSLGGELLSKMFSGSQSVKHPFAERLKEEVSHAQSVESSFKSAMSGMESAEKKLATDRSHSKSAAQAMHEAQKNLNEVVKKYGPISKEAHTAELELAEARKANKEATHAWASAEELTNTQQQLAIITAKEAINTDKPLLAGMREKVEHKKEEVETNGHTKESLEHLLAAEKELVENQEKLHTAFGTLKKLAPEQAEAYHHMDLGQHEFGKHFNALLKDIPEFATTTKETFGRAGPEFHSFGTQVAHFGAGVSDSMEGAEESITGLKVEGMKGIGELMEYTQEALSSLGVSKVHFKAKGAAKEAKSAKKAQGHHQTGGIVVPGAGSGDTVPLTAMVEPGEIVHVLNRNASKKLHQLESLNKAVPRFQEGGAMAAGGHLILDPGVNMSVGKEPQIAADLKKFSAEMNEAVYVISGYRSPAHSVEVGGYADDPHTRGEAADIGLGSPTVASMLGVAEKFIAAAGLYRFDPTSPKEANHVELLNGGPTGAVISALSGGKGNMGSAAGVVPKIKDIEMQGPAGALTELGNSALHHVFKAANEYIAKKAPGSTGGNFTEIQGNNAVEAAGKTLLANGLNKIGASGILGNAYQESGWDPGAIGSGGGGFLGFTAGEISLASLQAKAKEVGIGWEDPSFQMRFALEHISGSIISGLNSQKSPGSAAAYFMNEWEHPAVETENQANREAGAEKAYALGLQGGGTVAPAVPHPVKEIEGIVRGAGAKKPGPIVKAEAKVKPLLRMIEGFGIKGSKLDRLAGLTNKEESYGEYASEAEALDKEISAPAKEIEKLEKEGKPTEWLQQGKFNGATDGTWLNKKLGILHTLQKELGTDEHWVMGEKSRVVHIFQGSKKQLNEVMKNIRLAEKHKREVEAKIREIEQEVKKYEKEIREIEQAKTKSTKATEKEGKELEHQLAKAENAPKQTAAVHSEIQSLRAAIHSNKESVAGSGSATHAEVKALNEKITADNKKITGDNKAVKDIEHDITRFQRQETVLNEIIPTLESQREAANQTIESIAGTGGSVGSSNFVGLQTVQGIGGKGGGEIFSVERQLEAIQESLHPHIEPIVESELEKREHPLREIEAALALAELTPGAEDNIAALEREKVFDRERLTEAEGSNNLEEITQWAEALKGTEEAITGGSSGVTQAAIEEQLHLQEEININLKKELSTLQAQSPVMAQFESVGGIAHAGSFAMGGVVAAKVGENGVETVLMPNGSNVVSNAERRSVVSDSRNQKMNLNFEEIHFHEGEGRVAGKVNGEPFDEKVESYNRDTVRKATWNRTPGGSRDRR